MKPNQVVFTDGEFAQTKYAPALAAFFTVTGYVYLAWTDATSGGIVYSYTTDSGITWAPTAGIAAADDTWRAYSDQGPSLIQGPDSKLYAAWKGLGGNDIWYSTSSDGVTWSQQATITGASTPSKPSLSVGTGSVAVAYQGTDYNIYLIAFPTGIDSNFSFLPGPLNEHTNQAPALSATGWAGNGLIVSWKGKDDSKLRYWSSGVSLGGTGVVEGSGFTALSSTGPALPPGVNNSAPFGMVWKGLKDTIWGSPDFPNTPFTEQEIPDVATDVAPAYLGVGGLMAFKKPVTDKVSGNTLWTCTPF